MIEKTWKTFFSRNILNRGQTYYYAGRVHNLKYQSGEDVLSFQSSVRGSHLYQVKGRFEENHLAEIYCTCPYAQTSYCKHMAATILALEFDLEIQETRERRKQAEEEKQRRKNARKRIHPFQSDTSHYQYFDLGRLTHDLIIYDLDYQEALKQLESEDLELDFQLFYQPESSYNGMVARVSYGQAHMEFTHEKLRRIICDVYHCEGYRHNFNYTLTKIETCVHELKLLIMTERYLAEHEVGDSTDYHAVQFLNYMRTDAIHRVSANVPRSDDGVVRLVPRLIRSKKQLTLTFRIGREKLYAVKSLDKLVGIVSSAQQLPLGKNCTLDFRTDTFEEQSQNYYRFIQGCVQEQRTLQATSSRMYYIPDLGSSINLTGNHIDTLFQMAEFQEAEFVNKDTGNKNIPLVFSRKDPEITLTVRQDTENGAFLGVKLEGSVPAFLSGVSAQYYLDETSNPAVLYRISEEASRKLEPIRRLGLSGDISLAIGQSHLSEFFYDVLPVLQETLTIREPDAAIIESRMPPKAEFIIYLDAVDKVPVLKIESVYEDQVFSTGDLRRRDRPFASVRDLHRERQALTMVQRYFNSYDTENDQFHMENNDDSIYRLLDSGLKEFTAFCQVQSTSRFDALRIRAVSKVKVGVSIQSEIMNLTVSSGDLTPEELLDILKSYKLKKSYHRLPGGEFISIDDNIAELSATMDALHLTPKQFLQDKIHVPAYRALYLDKMLESLSGIQTSRDKHFRELIKNFKTVSESDHEVPESLADILRPYQAYGYQWLRMLAACGFGGILADDMGLGKTLQMIAVLLSEKEERDASASVTEADTGDQPEEVGGQSVRGTSLIICPASLVYNWAEEFHRFAPSLEVGIVAGTKSERTTILRQAARYDVLITSYDLLKRDVSLYEDLQFTYQVLDEAQFIKTHTTAAAKSVKILNSRHRFALTGTPIENRLSELWSIFDYLMPGFLYGYETFRKEFEVPIVKNEEEEASRRLKRMVSPFILRRLKADVLKDLPEKLEEVRYARFSADQQRLYDAQVVKLRGMISQSDDSQINQNKIAILAELTRTRQICCDPSLLFEDYRGESAKKDACLDLVRSAIQGEHRILLFSQFTSMLEILEQAFREEDIEYYKITGATPKQERMELVKAFNEGTVPLFLISLKAGGTGLNLTGADIVIHYDPWWNVAAQNQATDRAHRIGQTRTVLVYKLIAQGSIEEKILTMQKTKEKLADEILNGEAVSSGISGMTRQELLELLEC